MKSITYKEKFCRKMKKTTTGTDVESIFRTLRFQSYKDQ